ncbi:hypothetical protein ACHAXN_011457 [Cyclotella atomus]
MAHVVGDRLKRVSSGLKRVQSIRKKPPVALTHVQNCGKTNCIACNSNSGSTIFIPVKKSLF